MKPYVVIAALLAVLTAFAAGNIHGRAAVRQAWDLAAARQAAVSAQALAASETRARAREREYSALKDQIEKERHDAEAKLALLHADNARRLVAAGGLRDRAGRCDRGGVPATAASPAIPSEPAAGCRLSGETSRALLDLAARADTAAAYAAACRAWAVTLPR